MSVTLTYVIKFVGNMDEAVRFHTKQLGLKLRFQSPEWSEFETGTTTLALHGATTEHPAGTCQLGFRVPERRSLLLRTNRAGCRGRRGAEKPARTADRQTAGRRWCRVFGERRYRQPLRSAQRLRVVTGHG